MVKALLSQGDKILLPEPQIINPTGLLKNGLLQFTSLLYGCIIKCISYPTLILQLQIFPWNILITISGLNLRK